MKNICKIILLLFFSCSSNNKRPNTFDQNRYDQGMKIFFQNCGSCHGNQNSPKPSIEGFVNMDTTKLRKVLERINNDTLNHKYLTLPDSSLSALFYFLKQFDGTIE
jgi:hypothetical protein